MWALLLVAADVSAAEPDEPVRVAKARRERLDSVKRLFQAAGVTYPAGELYLRAFKEEGVLELWGGARGQPLKLVKAYPICASSGGPGPKRRQGDLQVPEGFYRIDRFNPWSNFHLSLGLDYPNTSDRRRGDAKAPGGDIFIHGSCVTIGCLPIEDGPIEELYLATLDARANGQVSIPVHIFPRRLDANALAQLSGEHAEFWRELEPGYRHFELTRRPPRVTVSAKGRYQVVP